MNWNYRIVKEMNKFPTKTTHGEDVYYITHSIKEVYYDDDNKPYSWSDTDLICGETIEDCKNMLELHKEAFDKPVLEIVEVNGKLEIRETV